MKRNLPLASNNALSIDNIHFFFLFKLPDALALEKKSLSHHTSLRLMQVPLTLSRLCYHLNQFLVLLLPVVAYTLSLVKGGYHGEIKKKKL